MRATLLKIPAFKLRCFACSCHFTVSDVGDRDLVENNLCRRCLDEWTALEKLFRETPPKPAKPLWPSFVILAACFVVGWMFWSEYLK